MVLNALLFADYFQIDKKKLGTLIVFAYLKSVEIQLKKYSKAYLPRQYNALVLS